MRRIIFRVNYDCVREYEFRCMQPVNVLESFNRVLKFKNLFHPTRAVALLISWHLFVICATVCGLFLRFMGAMPWMNHPEWDSLFGRFHSFILFHSSWHCVHAVQLLLGKVNFNCISFKCWELRSASSATDHKESSFSFSQWKSMDASR